MAAQFLDVDSQLVSDVGELAVRRVQEVPSEFLDHLKVLKDASGAKAGEFHLACSVPVAVHEMWLAAGYDMTKAPAKETLRRLRNEGLDAFITTNKSL